MEQVDFSSKIISIKKSETKSLDAGGGVRYDDNGF